ncbi:phosphatase PAP2 family protein [bacterium]|nr:phosphatase PAP2 family protein [bacterium]
MKVAGAVGVSVLLLALFLVVKSHVDSPAIPQSRLWMEYAMQVVREKKPAPTESARLYASIATIYYESLTDARVNGVHEREVHANTRVQNFLNNVYPDLRASTSEFTRKNNMTIAAEHSEAAPEDSIETYLQRYESDAQQRPLPHGKATKSNALWFDERKPFTPHAGQWKRWNLTRFDAQVPPPPRFMSKEHLSALKEVITAATQRTVEQSALVNFWGGVPGTEQPAGIWQNRLFSEAQEKNLSNEKYAYAQMVLAQVIADSFMECWKVKFIYNTKRPSMVAPLIGEQVSLAMNNPPFPSYVSGHSTISRAAAVVLGALFPDKKERFYSDAATAKNSRLWAGIHFPYDNDEGEKMGNRIGEYYVEHVLQLPFNR